MLPREVDHELAEHVDDDVFELGEGILEEGDSLLDAEQRLLVGRVADDTDDDLVEDCGRAADNVDVPERDRVERAGADRDDGRAVCHGARGRMGEEGEPRGTVPPRRHQVERYRWLCPRVRLHHDEPAVGDGAGQEWCRTGSSVGQLPYGGSRSTSS